VERTLEGRGIGRRNDRDRRRSRQWRHPRSIPRSRGRATASKHQVGRNESSRSTVRSTSPKVHGADGQGRRTRSRGRSRNLRPSPRGPVSYSASTKEKSRARRSRAIGTFPPAVVPRPRLRTGSTRRRSRFVKIIAMGHDRGDSSLSSSTETRRIQDGRRETVE